MQQYHCISCFTLDCSSYVWIVLDIFSYCRQFRVLFTLAGIGCSFNTCLLLSFGIGWIIQKITAFIIVIVLFLIVKVIVIVSSPRPIILYCKVTDNLDYEGKV